jgi:hypothetical protein
MVGRYLKSMIGRICSEDSIAHEYRSAYRITFSKIILASPTLSAAADVSRGDGRHHPHIDLSLPR